MIRRVLITLAAAGCIVLFASDVPAQEEPAPTPDARTAQVTRLLRFENVDIDDVEATLSVLPGRLSPNREAGVILWTGPELFADAVTEVARELDVAPAPTPNVRLAVWLVVASRTDDLHGGLPAELSAVERELRQVFGFASFKLLESTSLRVRAGSSGQLQGGVTPPAEPWSGGEYSLRFRRIGLSGGPDARQIRIDGLSLDLFAHLVRATPDGGTAEIKERGGIGTDIDVTPGQFAVVGQFTVPGSEGTVLLVLRAELQD